MSHGGARNRHRSERERRESIVLLTRAGTNDHYKLFMVREIAFIASTNVADSTGFL